MAVIEGWKIVVMLGGLALVIALILVFHKEED
jgi:hypothetical protein